MELKRKFINGFNRIINICWIFAGILLLVIGLFVIADILCRQLGHPIPGTHEIAGYLLNYIVFLVVAWVLRENKHVVVEIIVKRLKPNIQYLMKIATYLLGMIICLPLIWYGFKATWDSYQLGLFAATELRTPKFLILLPVPIGFFLLFIQFLIIVCGLLKSRVDINQTSLKETKRDIEVT